MNLVERLAKRFAEAKFQNTFGAAKDNPIIQFETRWWLNAIADELEQDRDDCSQQTAHWLRAQAKEEK